MSDDDVQLTDEQLPIPGVRVAMSCPRDDCQMRHFGDPDWKCPQHGRAIRQPNHPYFGQSTEPAA